MLYLFYVCCLVPADTFKEYNELFFNFMCLYLCAYTGCGGADGFF